MKDPVDSGELLGSNDTNLFKQPKYTMDSPAVLENKKSYSFLVFP